VALLAVPASAQDILFAQRRARERSEYSNSLAPYVTSPQDIVERMLTLADLKPGEMLYDLGSGDGRILITAVENFRAKAVGVEISDSLARASEDKIRRLGLQNQIRVIHADCRQVDLSPADVVTMYLMTDANDTMRPLLEKYLKRGARVVSHDYAVPGWKADRVERAEVYSRPHRLFLYVMPPRHE